MSAVFGVGELKAALDAMLLQVNASSVAIVRRGEAVVEAAAKKQFTGSHKKGTPTTSAPGSPPDVVSGTLRRSIISDVPVMEGFAAVGRVYPTAIYSRIQELGGRGLPPRPYMQPGYQSVTSRLAAIAVEEWGRATHR